MPWKIIWQLGLHQTGIRHVTASEAVEAHWLPTLSTLLYCLSGDWLCFNYQVARPLNNFQYSVLCMKYELRVENYPRTRDGPNARLFYCAPKARLMTTTSIASCSLWCSSCKKSIPGRVTSECICTCEYVDTCSLPFQRRCPSHPLIVDKENSPLINQRPSKSRNII